MNISILLHFNESWGGGGGGGGLSLLFNWFRSLSNNKVSLG